MQFIGEQGEQQDVELGKPTSYVQANPRLSLGVNWVRKFLWPGLATAFATFVVTIVVLANQGRLPQFLSFYAMIPGGDKLGHFGLMGLLSLLVNLAMGNKPIQVGRFQMLRGTAIVLVIVTLEELSQFFFPRRSLSWSDLLADYSGILTFSWLAHYFLSRPQS
jgi:VanZ family protein